MKTLFTGISGRSSSEVRGIQLASSSDNFFYCDQNRLTHEIIDSVDTVVFVRNFVDNIARLCKAKGKSVVYDLIDRPVADVHSLYKQNISNPQIDWDAYRRLPVDSMIVNNTLTKECLQQGSSCPPIKVIPHHSCNFEKYKKPFSSTIKTVGYVGIPDQICKTDEIRSWLLKKGIEFVSVNPKDRSSVLEAHRKIDVGLIFLENHGYYKEVMKYKPGQKLLNFQSIGIPAIACGYESFREFGGSAFLEVETLDDVFSSLTLLIESEKERKRIVNLGLKNSEKYTLEKLSRYYE